MTRGSYLVAAICICFTSFATASKIISVAVTPMTLGGIVNQDSDDTLAFTPDGNTVFFDRSDGPHKTIMISHRINGHWSSPQPASFSGRWFDQDPVVAPDGNFLLFNSDRPVSPGGKPLVQSYFAGGPGPGSPVSGELNTREITGVLRSGSVPSSTVMYSSISRVRPPMERSISCAGRPPRSPCIFGDRDTNTARISRPNL